MKIRNRNYSQWAGREELFERKRGSDPDFSVWNECAYESGIGGRHTRRYLSRSEPYFPYLCACGALLKVDGAPEYEQAIRKYLDHPNEQVRWWAEYALEIEGPTTAKRKAEDKTKHAQE
jgi:hypothetical protein